MRVDAKSTAFIQTSITLQRIAILSPFQQSNSMLPGLQKSSPSCLKIQFFHCFGISTLCSWELRNITPRTTVLSLAGENALISSITVMSSPSKATTRCQPVLLLPLFNIHRLGWNQRRSDFDNHHLWLLQPKALAFKSRQWLTQAICPSLEKINWNPLARSRVQKFLWKVAACLTVGQLSKEHLDPSYHQHCPRI